MPACVACVGVSLSLFLQPVLLESLRACGLWKMIAAESAGPLAQSRRLRSGTAPD
jgi:hypothetical protein